MKVLQSFIAALFLTLVCSASAATKPNIVLILADDLGFSDIGCYGSEISTPNIDKLAASGLRFSQFYNCSRCCPTRASLLTGLYPHAAGVGHMMQDLHADGYRGELNNKCVTIAEVLRGSGYQTGMVGKWHVAHIKFTGKEQLNRENNDPYWDDKHDWPLQRGFEKYFGTVHGVTSYYDPFSLVDGNTPIRAPKDFYYTDAISDHAEEYISAFATKAKPFFLYVSYTAPHWPLQAPESEIKKYRERYKVGWDEIRQQRYDKLKKLGLVTSTITPRDPTVPRWEDAKDKDWEANRMATYAAMIDKMDQGIGKILETLKKQNIDQNTLVIFLSDNGGCSENLQRDWYDVPTKTRDGRPVHISNAHHDIMAGPEDVWQSYGPPWANVSNTPFRLYKHFVHEGGIATPFVISWPGHVAKPGSITTELAHVIDLMPTFVDAAAAKYPESYKGQKIKEMAGRSLLPVLQTEKPQLERTLCWEHEGNRAVRQGHWKLVAKHGQPWELYDMSADRSELHNLAAKNPDRVSDLLSQYNNWATANGVQPWDEVRHGGRPRP